MHPAIVRILHPVAPDGSGPLTRTLADARRAGAARLARRFERAGASDVRVERGRSGDRPFGARVRELAGSLGAGQGLVVLGSGSIPLARRRDLAALLEVAASGERRALANSFYSADVVAVGAAANLASVPDLASDNALPRWLREEAGYHVEAMEGSRLGMDIDSPLDLVLLDLEAALEDAPVRARIEAIREVAADSSRELVVAGRSSARTLRWLERRTAGRTRALVEERGLKAAAAGAGDGPARSQRPARSVVGMLLDERGPGELGPILAELGDAAVVDTRVLMAHRLGADESAWPAPEDRYASDLLLETPIEDPWLRALTASARDAAIPILLGGHTLVGPGLRFVVGPR